MYSRISSLFLPVLDAARRLHISQRGQTGMEVALVGVVCATCVIGGVMIASGEEAAEQLDSVFHAGIVQASGTLVLSGSVIATASGDPPSVDEIVVTLGTIGRPAPVALDSTAETDRLVVAFAGAAAFDNDVAYTATELRGDGDGLLEPGETAEVRIDVSTIADGTLVIGPSEDWTLQIGAPSGGIVQVSRTMPFALQAVNSLR
jgi:flagellin FlaB